MCSNAMHQSSYYITDKQDKYFLVLCKDLEMIEFFYTYFLKFPHYNCRFLKLKETATCSSQPPTNQVQHINKQSSNICRWGAIFKRPFFNFDTF